MELREKTDGPTKLFPRHQFAYRPEERRDCAIENATFLTLHYDTIRYNQPTHSLSISKGGNKTRFIGNRRMRCAYIAQTISNRPALPNFLPLPIAIRFYFLMPQPKFNIDAKLRLKTKYFESELSECMLRRRATNLS